MSKIKEKMSKNKMSMCYPYGMGVSCICDSRARIYKCFPTLENDDHHDLSSEAMQSSRDGDGSNGMLEDFPGLDGMVGSGGGKGRLDERTEIILAATFLVLIILAFISFVIYRCEKNYLRRRQGGFHISPSSGFSSLGQQQHNLLHIPSISVSVQTEPQRMSQVNGNGHLPQQQQSVAGHTHLGYATLPLGSHLLHQQGQYQNSVDCDASAWGGREISNAQSYRDVREGILTLAAAAANSSRDNTLSRDAHHHISRDDVLGLRSSCTQDNLRSPICRQQQNRHSVVGALMSCPTDDDDANTEYAESDVLLGGVSGGGGGGCGSSGAGSSSNSNNGCSRSGGPGGGLERF